MKLESQFSEFIEFENIFAGRRYDKLKASLLAILMRQKDLLFRNSTDPDGSKWAPLSDVTKMMRLHRLGEKATKKNLRGTFKPLLDTGTLRNSITNAMAPYTASSTFGDEIILGTNVPYARLQNFGGMTEMRQTIKKGDREEIRTFKVKVPARTFMGFGDQERQKVEEKLEVYMKKELGIHG